MDKTTFNYEEAVEQLNDERSIGRQICNSLYHEMFPCKKNVFASILSFFLSISFATIIATSEKTVLLVQNISSTFLDVHLAIFGSIFAVYSILLAFLSDSYIKKLLKIGYEKNVSYLKAGIQYFESALYIYFVAIIFSLTYKIAAQSLPDSFYLSQNNATNEIIAFLLLLMYFLYSIRSIIELKSVIGNTLLLFRASLQFKILAFQDDESTQ